MVGWLERSWGYHGDDGCTFSEGPYTDVDDGYGEGCVIGMGINFDRNIAFLTKDGRVVGKAFSDVRGKLYPEVSVDQFMVGAKVSATFWNGDKDAFEYKGGFLDEATLVPPPPKVDSHEMETIEEDADEEREEEEEEGKEGDGGDDDGNENGEDGIDDDDMVLLESVEEADEDIKMEDSGLAGGLDGDGGGNNDSMNVEE